MPREKQSKEEIEYGLRGARGMFADVLAVQTTWDALGYKKDKHESQIDHARSLLATEGEVDFKGLVPRLSIGENDAAIKRYKLKVGTNAKDSQIFDVASLVIQRPESGPISVPLPGLPDNELLRMHLVADAERVLKLPLIMFGGMFYARSELTQRDTYMIEEREGMALKLLTGPLPLVVINFLDRPFSPTDAIARIGWVDEGAKLQFKVTQQTPLSPQPDVTHLWRRLNTQQMGQNSWVPAGMKLQYPPELPERQTEKPRVGQVVFSVQ